MPCKAADPRNRLLHFHGGAFLLAFALCGHYLAAVSPWGLPRRQTLGVLTILRFTAVMDACVCVCEKTMFLPARYTVAAAVFLSASAASAVEDATLKADLPAVSMLPACKAFIADDSPRDIYVLFEAGRCIGLIQGLG